MGKKKSSKRAKAKQAKAPSTSLTIDDLPNEVLPTILRNLSGHQILNCMHLNEGFYHASLDTFKANFFSHDVLEAACRKENLSAVNALMENQETKDSIKSVSNQIRVFGAAARTGNLSLCQLLGAVEDEASVASVQYALEEAAQLRHEQVSKYFLSQGAVFNYKISGLLCDAAANDDLEHAEFLLGLKHGTHKLDVNYCGNYYNAKPALHQAVSGSHIDMVQLLLDNGADINSKSRFGLTPVMYAKQEDVTRLLLTKNPDLTAVTPDLRTVLHFAGMKGNVVLAEEVLKVFAEQGKSVDTPDKTGKSALHLAAEHGPPAMVKWLVENGSDVNLLDKDGCSPLVAARDLETIRFLIQSGADMHFLSIKHGSVLHTLCLIPNSSAEIHDEILEAAIKDGVPLSATATTLQRKTALHLAAEYGRTSVLKRLIEAGADVNAHSSTGYTPLHLAAKRFRTECAEALLAAGAEINIRTDKGKLAKQLAYGDVAKIFDRVETEREKAAEEAAKGEAEEAGEEQPEKEEVKKAKKRSKRKRT